MDKAMSTLHNVVEAEQRNGGPQQKPPLEENEKNSTTNKE